MTAAPSHYDPVLAVVAALRDAGCHVQSAGRDRYEAQCPAHDDRDPSLSVGRGSKGEPKAVVYCHAGCTTGDILDALHLEPKALFADYVPDGGGTVHYLHTVRAWHPPGEQPKARPKPKPYRREKVAHYDYVWPDGTPCARVVKFHKVDPDSGEVIGKTFGQQRWDGDNMTYLNGLNGIDVPVYHADMVADTIAGGKMPVVVCEGEKDADSAIAAWHICATTNPMGAGSWRPHHTEALRGATVIVVADNDEAGRDHADTVAQALQGVAAAVMVRLPAHGKDLTDHIEAGGTFGDLQPLDPEEVAEDHRARVRAAFPAINWHELWADDTEEEWILEPLLPARRLVALYSAPKVGKSLLMLEMAVGISLGAVTLGSRVPRAFTVLYVDFENDPKGDIRTRLQAMGYGPDDLANLHYLSFPTIAALDSAAGGEQLLAAVDAYGAEVVVIDTVSRAVKGEENENDTWLAFYRHTGLALKQAKVALIRLDHSGKDETKGQRGGSAKSGDVDAIWRMRKETETLFSLECDAARVPIPIGMRHLVLQRVESPRLHHQVQSSGAAGLGRAHVDDLVAWLDANDYPDGMTVRDAAEALREHGKSARQDTISNAVKLRKERLKPWGE